MKTFVFILLSIIPPIIIILASFFVINKIITEVKEVGLKNIVNEIWEGQ